MNDVWLEVLGRAHPALVHLPIGILIALVLLELWALLRRRALERGTRGLLALCAALAALASAGSGWTLAEEPGYGGDLLELHRWLGVSLAACASLLALAVLFKLRRTYAATLFGSLVLLFLTGHRGAAMTHGEDFLEEPLRRALGLAQPSSEPTLATTSWYEETIAPIFRARCTNCHGESKRKGGLALHTPQALFAGGEDGVVLVAGDPAASEMLRRLRLPLEHDDHMPPSSKAQPSAEEIEHIAAWIAAGASLEDPAPASESKATSKPAAGGSPTNDNTDSDTHTEVDSDSAPPPAAPSEALGNPPTEAVAALRAEHLHVETIDPVRHLLWVDLGGRPETDDAFAIEHLTPLTEFISELSLAGSAVGDGTLPFLAEMPNLVSLDLSRTDCTSEGLAALRGHRALKVLRITQTRVDDDAIETLTRMPALERLYCWKSELTAAGRAELRAIHPTLMIEDGLDLTSQALETEAELVLSKPEDAEQKLEAVNKLCPVSGEPIDETIVILHAGDLVGFCCTQCPKRFWEDPESFPLEGD